MAAAYKHVFSPDLLAGKVALVTGGGSGICMGITEELMRHGARCAIFSRTLPKLEKAAAELRARTGGEIMCVRGDVRNVAEVEAAVDEVLAKFGRLDIAVMGAAGNFLCPATKLSTNALNTVMQIDAIGTFTCARTVYNKWMRANGGSIINITATLHWNGELLQTHPGMAKAAIEAMSKHLANEWGPRGVRVNCIAPGPIGSTEGFKRLGGFLPADVLDGWKNKIPLQRWGTSRDVANAALYLASDEASGYVTGSTVAVEGGAWMIGIGAVASHMPDIKSKM